MNLKSTATLLALSFYSMNSSAISPAYLLFPLEQASFEVNSNTKNKQKFDFEVKQHCFAKRCPIKIGLEYASTRGLSDKDPEKNKHIREVFFPEGGHHPRFPLGVHLMLHDAKSEIIIDDKTQPGEHPLRIYGGQTITSVFGHRSYLCLSPGKYSAELQILNLERDISELSLRLVVLNNFKIKCGD